jgi:HAD superfamily hydrolase (TIGR01484 family)
MNKIGEIMTLHSIPAWDELDMSVICEQVGIVAFDLDNTLARSKKPMLPAMAHRFSQLTHVLPIAIITGGRFELVVSQVLDVLEEDANRDEMYLMPTSGTRYYRWNGSTWHCEYAHDLSETDRDTVIASLKRHAKEQGIWCSNPWGEVIEDRGSQITFSALGQQAPIERKEAWDPDNTKKNRLAAAVSLDVPHLAVRSGGSTSVDISLRGVDKAFAVRELATLLNIDIASIVYVGDRMDPQGNDYPAATAGTIPVRVSGPEDTIRFCELLIQGLGH